MPRPCTACAHPERAAIESELLADARSFRTVAGRYGLSSSAVDRHRAKHMDAYTVDELLAPGDDGFWTRWTGSKLQRIPTPRLADLVEVKGRPSVTEYSPDAGFAYSRKVYRRRRKPRT